MFSHLTSAWKSLFQTNSGGHNLILLSIAERGFAVQSRLGIPGKWGFFAAGPPGRQVYEEAIFVGLVMTHFLLFPGHAWIVYGVVYHDHNSPWPAVAVLDFLHLMLNVPIWGSNITFRNRKLRKQ